MDINILLESIQSTPVPVTHTTNVRITYFGMPSSPYLAVGKFQGKVHFLGDTTRSIIILCS